MMAAELTTQQRPDATHHVIVQAVTVIMGTVVALTFLFGFGNVLTLALRLGVPAWVAPLVAPAVDLAILGLLAGTRRATPEQPRPARRLLVFANVATLALNMAGPIRAGDFGKAAFDGRRAGYSGPGQRADVVAQGSAGPGRTAAAPLSGSGDRPAEAPDATRRSHCHRRSRSPGHPPASAQR
jgi:hypothetical protein